MLSNKKMWWRSRTILTNIVIGGLVVLEAKTEFLEPILPISLYAIVSVVLPVVNVALRVITTTELNLSGEDNDTTTKS